MILPGEIVVHVRNVFLIVGLVILTPYGEFLLRGKGLAPAPALHDTFQLRSEAVDEISDPPAFPDVSFQVDRFSRTHSCNRSGFKYEFVVGEREEIVERAAAVVQRNSFAVIRLPDLEGIGQAVTSDMSAVFVVVPNHIGQRL